MGIHNDKTESDGFYPNGLLPNEAASVIRELQPKRWAKAEEHTAELIARIQPNWPAEKHRNAVASYVQRLISECILCQVFTFGSVPLKTYLPDGDIDLTAFSLNPSLKDNWAIKVRDMLEREEKNKHAEFRVKEVQYIQAEVKIIKCLVDNIVVDISFNQLGGLCTLCFLEEVDSLIDQDHLFKRSIILIKAWCYYESRILGAHHGLISTYALETLVLYIFHVFNSSFVGPLEVLYRFLEFFSKFDWENYCVSLWGPVPISSLPDITAKPPRKDGGNLLLSQMFLDACNAAYAVVPGGHENKDQPFMSKHFNVIDPLRTNNNLGRSVNKGNFFRIRSAFAFGAQRLARLLECPEVNIVAELNQFFMNTWERHGKGPRPDACITDAPELRIEDSEHVDNLQNYGGRKKATENSSDHNFRADQTSKYRFSHVQHGNLADNRITKILNESVVGHPHFQQSDTNSASLQSSDEDQQATQRSSVNRESQNDRGRTWRKNVLPNDVPVITQFARTYSSPELRNTSSVVMSQGRRYAVAQRLKDETKPGYARGNWGEIPNNHCRSPPTDEPSKETFKAKFSNASINGSVDESVSGAYPMRMHQEGKYFVKVTSSSRPHNFYGQVQMPLNFSSQLPVPIPASFWEYAYHNSLGRIPSDLPSFDSRWESNMHQPHIPFPLPVSQDFSQSGKASEQEEMTGTFNSDLTPRAMNQQEDDNGVWADSESYRELDHEVGKFQAQDVEWKQQSTSAAAHFGTLGQTSNSDHHGRKTHHNVQTKEKREFHRHNYTDSSGYKNDRASGVFSTASSRFSSHSGATPRTKCSSENWWDGSPPKTTTARNQFGRKTPPSVNPIAADVDRLRYEGELVDHECGEAADSSDQISVLTAETADPSVSSSHVKIHQVPGSGAAHLSYPNLVLPIAQMPGNVESRMAHNHAVVPIAFYPAGPPVPFVTMVPFYNIPTETGTSCESTNLIDVRVEDLSSPVKKSDQHEDSVKTLNQPGSSNTYPENEHSSFACPEERKSDILTSDLASHRLNLQYGRLCQNPQSQVPLICPPSVVVPPLYSQGHQPLDIPGRSLPVNAELYNHLMNLDPRLMSVASPQPGSTQPAGVYQQYGGEIPRSRAGTGTYLPKPKVFKDRNFSGPRNHRGNYNNERKEHNGEREANSRAKVSGRGQARYQSEKANMRMERPLVRNNELDRPWDQMRHNLYIPHRSTSGPASGSRSARIGPGDADSAMYPMPLRSDGGVSPSGDAPSLVMMYPNDQTGVYGSLGQQVQQRSVKSMPSFNRDNVPGLCQYSRGAAQSPSYECDSARSSPDRPIS